MKKSLLSSCPSTARRWRRWSRRDKCGAPVGCRLQQVPHLSEGAGDCKHRESPITPLFKAVLQKLSFHFQFLEHWVSEIQSDVLYGLRTQTAFPPIDQPVLETRTSHTQRQLPPKISAWNLERGDSDASWQDQLFPPRAPVLVSVVAGEGRGGGAECPCADKPHSPSWTAFSFQKQLQNSILHGHSLCPDYV